MNQTKEGYDVKVLMINCRKTSRGQLLCLGAEEGTKSLNVLNVLSPGYYLDAENIV